MLFLSPVGYAIGIISGLIGIYLFIESRPHSRARQRAVVFGMAALVIVVVTYLAVNQPSQSASGDSTYATCGEQIGLWAASVAITVSSFKVIAL